LINWIISVVSVQVTIHIASVKHNILALKAHVDQAKRTLGKPIDRIPIAFDVPVNERRHTILVKPVQEFVGGVSVPLDLQLCEKGFSSLGKVHCNSYI
jgi:hypothetical protein